MSCVEHADKCRVLTINYIGSVTQSVSIPIPQCARNKLWHSSTWQLCLLDKKEREIAVKKLQPVLRVKSTISDIVNYHIFAALSGKTILWLNMDARASRPANAHMPQWIPTWWSLVQVVSWRLVAPSHCMNQRWLIYNKIMRNNLQIKLNQITVISFENKYENVASTIH